MALIIRFEDREFTIDKDKITVDEWRELKRKYGMTPKGFDDGIGEADPDASTFLYWIMLRRGGDTRAVLGDQLKPDIIALNAAIAAAESDVPAVPEPEDPTLAGSLPDGVIPTSNGSTRKTSAISETSTSSPLPGSAGSGPPA
jgi:hypothetical protein